MVGRVAGAAVAALLLAATAGAGSIPLRVAVEELAQDGGHVAWRGGGCHEVHVRAVPRGFQARLGDAASSDCTQTERSFIALARKRALWTNTGSGNETYVDVMTGAPGERPRLVEQLVHSSATKDGEHATGMAGGGDTLVYSVINVSIPDTCIDPGRPCYFELTGGRVMRVVGRTARRVRGAPAALALAVSGRRIALVVARRGRSMQSLTLPSRAVQIRDLATGASRRLEAAAPVREIALTPSVVAVLTSGATGTRIERFAASREVALGRTRVATNASDLSASPFGIVYRTGRTIRTLGRARPLAVAAATPIGLSIDGRRVVWAENVRGRGRIRTLLIGRPTRR